MEKPCIAAQKMDPAVRPIHHQEDVINLTAYHANSLHSRHMDKHERPHKCENPQCATLLGFTYAGGLLRHEREVHNKHDELEGQLVCPYKDCKRHTSKAFTRRENLQEHLRRIHKIQGTDSVDAVAQDTPRLGATPYDHDPDNEGRASKRKRRSTMCHTEDPSEKSIRAQILEVKVENLELHHMWETQSRQLHEMREEINQFPAHGNIHLPGWRSDGIA
ncbi:hypothetical protein D6D01_10345 [Aureobasidium pullulans]|uniref:C2H2-type domain-containing protein n=1 Tax=Aureobasidium pullulans TaxID=5580 RepID=A0A4S9JH70_AURPU|nr:hypothetical protein D6D01_10345 [Aureobasidium pullulans]